MSQVRELALNRLQSVLGKELAKNVEAEIYDSTRRECTSHPGWDFFPFRNCYRQKLCTILENLANPNSNLLELLRDQNVTDVLKMDHRQYAKDYKPLDVSEPAKEVHEEGQYKCGACRGTNTQHFEYQSRSADEPMTIKVFCRQCGNIWKFSN